MWIKPGELLQSFIFRKSLLLNELNKSIIVELLINKKFCWRFNFGLTESTFLHFQTYDMTELLTLVEEHSILKFFKLVNTPDIFLKKASNIFNNTDKYITIEMPKTLAFLNLEIQFCPICFKEQINTDGFTWFKLSWCHHDVCEVHHISLFKHGCHCDSNKLNNYQKLKSIVTGTCNVCGFDIWNKPVTTQKVINNCHLDFNYYVTPCYYWSFNEYLELIRRELHKARLSVEFKKNVEDKLHSKAAIKAMKTLYTPNNFNFPPNRIRSLLPHLENFPETHYRNGRRIPITILEWCHRYVYFKENFSLEWKAFRKSKIEALNWPFQQPNQGIKRKVFVDKNRECDKCKIPKNECIKKFE
ncbi:hypothetical protein J7384_05470 [Endozoicomonas sp. G2_1]|uniref:hypothetical protein n=1 Tax=Endozoicomonas sp. G2_1 TaxID=2821091 RepID=UPI001ADABAD3|nr:hypothetical protein [Endozoicomonas sp. G2_1]MBO9489805.1 hypothetical protein [Endozoicomonas sp. G2_1]